MKRLLAGVALTALVTGGALAADLPAVAPVLEPTPVDSTVFSSTAFPWEGFYGAVGGGVTFEIPGAVPGPTGFIPVVTGALGYNAMLDDNVVLGVELSGLFYLDGHNNSEVYATARLGALVSDDVMVYGLAGAGAYDFDFQDAALYVVGIGAEAAVTDNLGLRGEVRFDNYFVNPSAVGFVVADASLVWHFN